MKGKQLQYIHKNDYDIPKHTVTRLWLELSVLDLYFQKLFLDFEILNNKGQKPPSCQQKWEPL